MFNLPDAGHIPHIEADAGLINPYPINLQGKNKTFSLVAWNFTDDTGTATLFIDGEVTPITIPDQEGWAFDGLILALSRETSTLAYGWHVYGVLRRQVGAANTALYGGTVTGIGGDLGPPTAPSLAADTTNGGLTVTVSGLAGKTIDYLIQLDLAEIKTP